METPSGSVIPDGRPFEQRARPTWIVGAFALFVFGMACATAAILVHDGRALALLAAPIVAGILYRLERREARRAPAKTPAISQRIPLNPAFLIALAPFVVLIPTLSIWFVSDDYGALVAFHHLSLAGFIKMFHSDLAAIVEGEPGREIRPLFAAFYFVNYKLWGLHPLGYHVFGLCAHTLNALLVFEIANRIAPGNSLRAALAGLLFALQPVDSMAVSWIAGTPAEILPTLFYLLALVFFMRYRLKPLRRYLAVSATAFLACLCIKEIAVTLPAMLVSYDLFERYRARGRVAGEAAASTQGPFPRLLAAYVPFAFLLMLYLAWRRVVFSRAPTPDEWATAIGFGSGETQTGLAHFAHWVAHVARFLVSHYVFAVRQLLLPFPLFVVGIVLGMYLVWALLLLRKRPADVDLSVILYFGLVWFMLADLPLLLAALDARHLYLPAVGPCIAVAFCALPAGSSARETGNVRLATAALLLALAGAQLTWLNEEFSGLVAFSRNEDKQLAAELDATPSQALLVVRYPAEEVLPFPLQPPFAPAELTRFHSLIAPPSAYGWPLPEWWQNMDALLHRAVSGAPAQSIELDLLVWNKQSGSYTRSKRVLPQGMVDSTIGNVTGHRPDVSGFTEEQGDALVDALAGLVLSGPRAEVAPQPLR